MKISVDLLDRSYDISIGSGVFANALELFASMKSGGAKFICVADSSVLKAHPKKAESLSRTAARRRNASKNSPNSARFSRKRTPTERRSSSLGAAA